MATKKCRYCAEEIQAEAVVCRFCGRPATDAHIERLAVEWGAISQELRNAAWGALDATDQHQLAALLQAMAAAVVATGQGPTLPIAEPGEPVHQGLFKSLPPPPTPSAPPRLRAVLIGCITAGALFAAVEVLSPPAAESHGAAPAPAVEAALARGKPAQEGDLIRLGGDTIRLGREEPARVAIVAANEEWAYLLARNLASGGDFADLVRFAKDGRATAVSEGTLVRILGREKYREIELVIVEVLEGELKGRKVVTYPLFVDHGRKVPPPPMAPEPQAQEPAPIRVEPIQAAPADAGPGSQALPPRENEWLKERRRRLAAEEAEALARRHQQEEDARKVFAEAEALRSSVASWQRDLWIPAIDPARSAISTLQEATGRGGSGDITPGCGQLETAMTALRNAAMVAPRSVNTGPSLDFATRLLAACNSGRAIWVATALKSGSL